MNRSELIQRLALRHPQLTVKDCDLAARAILDALSRALANGGRIELRGFGSFCLNYRPPRKGRNPKTGAAVMIPAKYTPHFKAGKELRERVNEERALTRCATSPAVHAGEDVNNRQLIGNGRQLVP
jgi:integration host factor subunit beta